MAPVAAPVAKTEKKKAVKVAPDSYVGSRTVTGLTIFNFADFLEDKDVSLVMFYDPKEALCDWSKKHFLKAAKTTSRANHAYCAVDCTQQEDLCSNEEVNSFPLFKMYSKGRLFAACDKPREFTYFTMRKYVENTPVLEIPQRPKRPC